MSETFGANALPIGTMVQEFRIVEVLGAGGFGIVYKAENAYLPEFAAIKELFPVKLCRRTQGTAVVPLSAKAEEPYRWALRKFLKEAQLLYELSHPQRHPNIICVSRFQESNGTAYMTMDFEEGRPLSKVLGERDPATEAELYDRALTVKELQERTLGENSLQILLEPLLDGLTRVHEVSIWHRDIKPANILVRSNGSPVLIDFGAARQERPDRTYSRLAMFSPAYAAPEHVMSMGEQGPWTDIYSLGATAYRAIAGKPPTAAYERALGARHITAIEAGAGRYSDKFLSAIDAALSLTPKDRPQSARAWRSLLKTPDRTVIRPKARPSTETSTEPYIGASTVVRPQPRLSKQTRTEPYIGAMDFRPEELEQPGWQRFHAATSTKYPQGRFRLRGLLSAIIVGIAVAVFVFLFVNPPPLDRVVARKSSPAETPVRITNNKRDPKHQYGFTPPGTPNAPPTTNTNPLTPVEPRQEQTTMLAKPEPARKQEEIFCEKVAFSTNRSALERYLQEKPQGLCWDEADRRRAELLEQDKYAQLVIRSNVSNDSVFINGERGGPTGPNPHRLRKGRRYEISVEKHGYQPWTMTIGELDDDIVLQATLTKNPLQKIVTTAAPLQKTPDRSFCNDLRTTSEAKISELRSYLEKFPSGFCSDWARDRVAALHKAATIKSQCNDLRRDVPALCLSNRYGCLESNCQNGFGIKRYEKGNCYWGDWVNGAKKGDGGWYIPKAGGKTEVLYGEVHNGKVISGVYASASGNCFVGSTDPETRMHVRGTVVFLDGGIHTIGEQ